MSADERNLADAFLAHHLRFRPVDATFMGLAGHDHRLPPADAGAAAEERRGIEALHGRLATAEETAGAAARTDRRIVEAELAKAAAELDLRPRFLNPAWYIGEAAFGVIALLLPQAEPVDGAAVAARLEAIPDFLADGRARLAGAAAPRGWTLRAIREAQAAGDFLSNDVSLHPAWRADWARPASLAAQAFEAFAAFLESLPDAPFAAGEPFLDLILRRVHGFDFGPDEAERRAKIAFDEIGREIEERAGPRWSDEIAALAQIAPQADEVPGAYRHWHERAMDEARNLVTPADDYGLDFRTMAPAFRSVSQALYFLSYRCPPAGRAGQGSVYWIAAPDGDLAAWRRAQNTAAIKSVHAVHHGSVGHHTQNARARAAPSRLARLAGTDCASGIALLSAGTMVEGWACYAQELMLECSGFYTPAEVLQQKGFERRNAASVLVDIRIHRGEWTLDEARRFYLKAGFAPGRVDAELVRNTMFPGTRLMYWLGVEAIKALRGRWQGDARAFHDTLLGHGHVAVAWTADEMERTSRFGG